MRLVRAGLVTAVVGGVLALVAIGWNSLPGPSSADANIGAGLLLLAALGVMAVGGLLLLAGALRGVLSRRRTP